MLPLVDDELWHGTTSSRGFRWERHGEPVSRMAMACASCCVCALGEREEGEGICFCVDREGRGQLLLQVQAGARGWSMEMNGLLFKVGVAQ